VFAFFYFGVGGLRFAGCVGSRLVCGPCWGMGLWGEGRLDVWVCWGLFSVGCDVLVEWMLGWFVFGNIGVGMRFLGRTLFCGGFVAGLVGYVCRRSVLFVGGLLVGFRFIGLDEGLAFAWFGVGWYAFVVLTLVWGFSCVWFFW